MDFDAAKKIQEADKGHRGAGVQMPVLVQNPNECVVIHGGCKFSFVCDLPLEAKLTWHTIHGSRVDDRVQPELPRGFDRLRPLRPASREVFHQAKKTAMGVLTRQRTAALARSMQPSLFSTEELPILTKPHRK